MTQTIKIKRSSSAASPSALQNGELAYSSNSNYLYIGRPGGGTGDIDVIGGKAYTDMLEGTSAVPNNLIIQNSPTVGGHLELREATGNGSNYVRLKSPNNLTANRTYTLPASFSSGQFLTVDGSGNLSFAAVPSGSFTIADGVGSPANTDTFTTGQTLVFSGTGGTTTTVSDNQVTIDSETNLSVTATGTSLTVASDTGTNASIPAATTSAWGAMTDEDKSKLDGIAAGAQVNVGTNLGNSANGTSLTVTSSTGSNTSLPAATTTTWGVMTDEDKSKLDGIAAGAQVNVGTDLGYVGSTRTLTSSTGSNQVLPEVVAGGNSGLMTGGDKTKLDGIAAGAQVNVGTNLSATADGTQLQVNSSTGNNVDLPAATTTAWGVMTDEDKSKLDGIDESANNYTHPNHSGDVTSSGDGTTTISANAVTHAKYQQVATDTMIGRTAAGTGNVTALTAAEVRGIINVADGANNYSHPNHSGDVTSSGDGATTISANAVTHSKYQQVATDTIIGRTETGTGDVTALTAAEVRGIINVADGAQVNVGTNLGYTASTRTITSSTGSNTTLPNVVAAGNSGLMTGADKTKLDGIATGANNYSLPLATSTVRGGIELFSNTDQSVAANSVTTTAGRTYGLQLNSNNQGVVNVPWTDVNVSVGNLEARLPQIDTAVTIGNGVTITAGGNFIVSGDLTVNGTQTILNTETLTVDDNIIVLNNNATGTPASNQDAGIEVERGDSTNVQILWDESASRWTFTNNGSSYNNIPLSTEYDKYTSWTVGDGTNTEAVTSGFSLTFDSSSFSYTAGTNTVAITTIDGGSYT